MNPSPAQMLVAATEASAVPGSRSKPGDLTTGKASAIQPTLASTPTSGCSRNSHIRLATATPVAIVDVKMNRNTASPRRYLSASTARPTPRANPNGTVIRANLTVTQMAWRNSTLRATSMYWSHPLDVQFSPWASHRMCPSQIADPSGYSTNVNRMITDGASIHTAVGRSRQRETVDRVDATARM